MTEYLQEESKQLPSKNEVSDYIHTVDRVRLAVERAEARIAQLNKSQQINGDDASSDTKSVDRDL